MFPQINEDMGTKTDNEKALTENVELLKSQIAKSHAGYLIRLKCNKGGLLFEGNYV